MKYIYFIIPSVILGVILGIIYTKRNTETNPLPKNCEFVDILPDKPVETNGIRTQEYRSGIKAIIKENINDAKEYDYDPHTGIVYDLEFDYPIGKVYFVNGEAKKYDNIYIINEFNKTQQNEFYKTQQNELYELKKLYNAKQIKLYNIDKSIYNQVYDSNIPYIPVIKPMPFS
jgi:hypothetical protein